MANKRKLAFIVGSIAVCWIGWAALVGIFAAVAHLLKSTTAGITFFLVTLYSSLFGLLGWQVYTWKGRRDGWPRADARERRTARIQAGRKKDADKTDDGEAGWKRSDRPKGKSRE